MTISLINDEGLRQLLKSCTAGPCVCAVGACDAWESITEDRWPAQQMRQLGTLRDPELYEPTFEEHHPCGTRYDSGDAPIAVKYFPYNRCDVFACTQCERRLLRYTEFGGYYVDHRVRELRAHLLVDPSSP
jgi:hypothetical protein